MTDRHDPRSPRSGGRRVGTLDLPEGTAPDLVRLLERAAGPSEAGELKSEAAAVAAFVAQQAAPAEVSHRWHASRRTRVLAALSVSGSLVLGGGLAAADVLPAPAQRWVSSALGSLGIDVPSPDDRDGSPRSGEGPGQTPTDTTMVDAESAGGPAPAGVPAPFGVPGPAGGPAGPGSNTAPGTAADEDADARTSVPSGSDAPDAEAPGRGNAGVDAGADQGSGAGSGTGSNTNKGSDTDTGTGTDTDKGTTGGGGTANGGTPRTDKPATPDKVDRAPGRPAGPPGAPAPRNTGRGTVRDAPDRANARDVSPTVAIARRAETRSVLPAAGAEPKSPDSAEPRVSGDRSPRR